MIPNELCHYTKKDIALEKILFEGKIKLSQIGRTNDPKESSRVYHSVSYFPALGDKNAEGYYFLLSNEFQKIHKEWKVLCMTMHLPKQKHQNQVMSEFRYGWSRPTMWAHYADNHSGICIIFDGKELHKNIQSSLRHHELFYGKVDYEKPEGPIKYYSDFQEIITNQLRDSGLRDEIRKYIKKHHREYFFSKFSAWKNESEYRWLAHNSTNTDDEFVDIQGAVKSILVGSNFPKVYKPSIKEIGEKLNIEVGEMQWQNGIPSPHFGKIHKPQVKKGK